MVNEPGSSGFDGGGDGDGSGERRWHVGGAGMWAAVTASLTVSEPDDSGFDGGSSAVDCTAPRHGAVDNRGSQSLSLSQLVPLACSLYGRRALPAPTLSRQQSTCRLAGTTAPPSMPSPSSPHLNSERRYRRRCLPLLPSPRAVLNAKAATFVRSLPLNAKHCTTILPRSSMAPPPPSSSMVMPLEPKTGAAVLVVVGVEPWRCWLELGNCDVGAENRIRLQYNCAGSETGTYLNGHAKVSPTTAQ
uniref:Uncharacterized protein n=1 Tax=Oryza nivara TaxID=4536 RepID=A0A0E0GY16_ORYNI